MLGGSFVVYYDSINTKMENICYTFCSAHFTFGSTQKACAAVNTILVRGSLAS